MLLKYNHIIIRIELYGFNNITIEKIFKNFLKIYVFLFAIFKRLC